MTQQTNSKKKNLLKYGGIVITVAVLLIVANQLGVTDYINQGMQATLRWIDSLGIWGPIAFIAIYATAAVFLVSGGLLTLGAGVLFQPVWYGFIIVSLASTVAAAIAFLIGRYIARDWVSKKIEQQPKFKAIDKAVAREGWKIVGLTRLSPIFPFVFLNYAFGVTKVSLRDYVIASWIGMMPGTVMYVYLGSLAGNIATLGAGETPENAMVQWVLRIVGFIATVAVTVYVTKIARKALNEEIEEDIEEVDPAKAEDQVQA
ncbi:TVP38/TMEM64 family protein [Spirulina sp. CS-785/01]|uniref:TVP38/TMEM64 family protein n=1 Tax=Spirulina sp. CS-785/01 TaxID=3021716 RepID=UPI00232ADEBC|nr:TVP38/TMEM64 family protein [Spirulina sp. CS-785/01]MDB9315795.1 TVP38/TMEM64 family protein [Spirulina sp. CS-785/01]